jgi:CDP-paratose 2-epimerase
MKILITGGCGFLGSNLAAKAIAQKDDLVIFDNLSRNGSRQNLAWLEQSGQFSFMHGDISNRSDIERLVADFNPEAVFHLAGQVAMTTSIADPRRDFEINSLGTLNLLEAIRNHAPQATVVYSSTNKVYGDLDQFNYTECDTRYRCVEYPDGFDEGISLEFHSPYGCSKGAADQYMLDYARVFGLNTVVFRHSSMYGGRQFSTYDQGWIGWFCQQAFNVKQGISKEPFSISGNGKQVRDVLHADDMVTLYFAALKNKNSIRGQALNIGGGMKNSLSLHELFHLLEKLTGVSLNYVKLPARESDQRVFVADISKAKRLLHWEPCVSAEDGIKRMLEWVSVCSS